MVTECFISKAYTEGKNCDQFFILPYDMSHIKLHVLAKRFILYFYFHYCTFYMLIQHKDYYHDIQIFNFDNCFDWPSFLSLFKFTRKCKLISIIMH